MSKSKEQKLSKMDSVLDDDNAFYAFVPRIFFTDNKFNGKNPLSMDARVLLGLLLSFRNLPVIRLSQETMGKMIGRSRQSISKYLKELKEAGLITSIRTKTTCQTSFTSIVNNSIKRCKASLSKESNKRNKTKKVYKEPFLKNHSLKTQNNRSQYDDVGYRYVQKLR